MSEQQWDERYRQGRQWSTEPNETLASVVVGVPPGRALDLAGGEGRNALWLASRGWRATVVDFSEVALARGREHAAELRLSCEWVHADLVRYEPAPGGYDLVAVVFLHLAAPEQRLVLGRAADAVAPGGTLVVLGHHPRNVTEGVGGPQDPAILHDEQALAAWVTGRHERAPWAQARTGDGAPAGRPAAGGAPGPLVVERAELVERQVAAGRALDALVVARRAPERP